MGKDGVGKDGVAAMDRKTWFGRHDRERWAGSYGFCMEALGWGAMGSGAYGQRAMGKEL